jgi:flagellar protein FlaG
MDINSVSTSVVGNSALQSGIKPAVELSKPQQIISPVTPSTKAPQEAQKVTAEQVAEVNSNLEQLGVGIAFSVDESTQSSVIKVIDKTTNEVIKQYPNEGSLEMMKNIQGYLDALQTTSSSNNEALKGSIISEMI